MRRTIVPMIALVCLVAAPAIARAQGRTVTTISRIERISYPATGCRADVTMHERYRLRYHSIESADGTIMWTRTMRGTVRFREGGQRFGGRFAERARASTLEDPGTYTLDRRMRAAAPDGTTLRLVSHEEDLIPLDGPRLVLERTLQRTCD